MGTASQAEYLGVLIEQLQASRERALRATLAQLTVMNRTVRRVRRETDAFKSQLATLFDGPAR